MMRREGPRSTASLKAAFFFLSRARQSEGDNGDLVSLFALDGWSIPLKPKPRGQGATVSEQRQRWKETISPI